jgi:putative ABC transport system permease protein
MLKDLIYSLRLLRRSPGFAVAAIATLALAIGASTAVFTVVNAVLLRPLPIDDPDRVVVIWPRERANPTTVGEISHWAFRNWQERTRTFERLAAIGSVNWGFTLREGEQRIRFSKAAVSASFFSLMGTRAALGRTLLPEDDRRGAPAALVMSHGTWIGRFGGDPRIVGRRLLSSDGVAHTVVGVMPADFDYPRGAELWAPVVPELAGIKLGDQGALDAPWFGVLWVMGRLKPGVTIDAARDEVSGFIARNEGRAFGPDSEAVLTSLRDHIFGKSGPALAALAGCVALVLLIACANVAALLIVRAGARSQEFAVRLALGAGRWRILRQMLADALVLSLIGGAAGLVVALWTVKGLVAVAPPDVPRLDAVRFDFRSVAFAWLVCIIAAALAGLGPGLHASRWNLADTLKAGSARLTRSRSLRRGFVAVQIALGLALLVGAGLVGRSFVNLLRLDLGFQPRHVVTLDVSVPEVPAERYNNFYVRLLERVRAIPHVEAAGAIFLRPLEHTSIGTDASVLLEGQSTDPKDRAAEQNPGVNYETATPGYFGAMGMRLLRGRVFTDADTARAPQVVIVSERLARRLWPGREPIGKRLLHPNSPEDSQGRRIWSTVVGVVQDARYRGLNDVRYDLYVPFLQQPADLVKHLMVRTSGDPGSVAAAIRAEARRLEPTAMVDRVRTMDEIVGQAVAPWRFSSSTLGILSVLALGLAMLGVYGIVSQSVIERTREIAVRVALGAVPRDVIRLVLREGMVMTVIGVLAGLTAAIVVGRVMGALLFGVGPIDPVTFGAMAALLTMVSVAATLIPARRALRIDPASALRQE